MFSNLALIATLLLAPLAVLHSADSSAPDLALQPAHIVVAPWKQHIPPTKRQGVAGIERTAKGRLWAVYDRDVESTRNFQVLKCSDDDGKTCSEVKLMILPREGTRAMSANVWIDPQGRLWVFWGQSAEMQDGRFGLWAIVTDEPDGLQLRRVVIYTIGTDAGLEIEQVEVLHDPVR